MATRPLSPFAKLLEVAEKKRLERVKAEDFPVVPSTPPSTPGGAETPQSGTPRDTPRSTPLPPGIGVDNGVDHQPARHPRVDTRAQLNLKISLEKMFQLKQFCEDSGVSQREAIEEAIGLLCCGVDQRGRPPDQELSTPTSTLYQIDLIDDSDIKSIIDFYTRETGNIWTPSDEAALRALNGRMRIECISAGIIKSLIGSRGRVNTFAYCAKCATQIAAAPELNSHRFLKDLWRRYDRVRGAIARKQGGE